MVPLKNERRVFLWRMVAAASPPEALNAIRTTGEAVSVSMDEIISILEAELSGGRARMYLKGSRLLDDDDPDRDEKSQIYIADIRRVPVTHTVTLLINRGDPNVVSPAFIDPANNAVRIEAPKEGEAPGASAHLVISLAPSAQGARACFEQMPHVSSSLVLTALERMIARAISANPTYKYQVINHDRKGRPHIAWKDYRPSLATRRVPSEKLLDDLEIGELSGLTLTKKATYYQGVGVADLIKRQEQKVVISLKSADKASIVSLVQGIVNKAREEEYESVSFDVTKLPGDATSSPTITLDDQDAMEQLYVRAQRLTDFGKELEQCYAAVCDELCERMRHIVHQGNW